MYSFRLLVAHAQVVVGEREHRVARRQLEGELLEALRRLGAVLRLERLERGLEEGLVRGGFERREIGPRTGGRRDERAERGEPEQAARGEGHAGVVPGRSRAVHRAPPAASAGAACWRYQSTKRGMPARTSIGGRVAEQRARARHVGVGAAHVARLRRAAVDHRGAAGGALEERDQLGHRCRRVAAEIDDLVAERDARACDRPRRGRRCTMSRHVRVVARRRAVAEDGQRLPALEEPGEGVDREVGPLARPVDREEAERDEPERRRRAR